MSHNGSLEIVEQGHEPGKILLSNYTKIDPQCVALNFKILIS